MTARFVNDRAVGALVGSAVGDALGVPYEFGSRRAERAQPADFHNKGWVVAALQAA
jgi:ADP-ribosylglycohydrolase